jgi:serine/threonine protein kinase
MDPDRLREIEALYHSARERASTERLAFLKEACRNDEELFQEVALLLAPSSDSDPMEKPVFHMAAALLTGSEAHWTPGTRVGPYQILGHLGEGGMGTVYKARDTRLGREVAIKTSKEVFSGRFQREARAISSLNHPHICTLFDVGPDFLVMELVEGETLAARLERGRLSMESVLGYGAQIADALSAAHARGIVHRDLKPANIMVTSMGVKVVDFGLAKMAASVEFSETVTDSQTIVGTPAYMAPEQLEGREADARTDIFALGLVLYEMATRRKPFKGENRAELIADIMRGEPALGVLTPPNFAHLVERCLAKDPNNRWQTTRDVSLELQFLTRAQPPAQPPRRARGRWLVAAAAVSSAAALALWYFQGSPAEPVVVPLTTDPGLQSWPSFSPDGTRVAYSWNGVSPDNFDIWVRQIGPGAPQRLTSDPEWDVAPRWSPDGTWIAFSRRQGSNTGVYVIPSLGGPERKVGDADALISDQDWNPTLAVASDWSHDGQWLLVAKRPSGGRGSGLALLSFETGDHKQLTSPAVGSDGDAKLAPDGRAIAFRRDNPARLMVLPLARSGEPRGQPKEILHGTNQIPRDIAWSADSRELIVSFGDAESSRLWRVPASSGTARMLSFAPMGANFPAVARHGDRMAFSQEHWHQNIWSLELDRSGQAIGPAVRAFDSTASEYAAQFSPDGTRVVFQSSRSGTGVTAIWTCFADGSNCAQLSPAGGPHAGSPSWSPDGRWVAYDIGRPGERAIYVINSGGGAPRLLIRSEEGHFVQMPRWSADGQWVYYADLAGGVSIRRIRASGGEPQLVAQRAGRVTSESPDGKWLYYSTHPNSAPAILHRMPVDGGAATEVLPRVAGRNVVVVDTGIWFLAPSSPGSLLQFYDFSSKSTRTVYRTTRPVWVGLTLSPDRRRVLFSQVDEPTSRNLMLIENFR